MASTTLTRTPSSAGNQKTWTLSTWVKNSYGGMFFCVDSHGATKSIQCDLYQDADFLEFAQYASGSGAWSLKTNRLFRDRNAWYHIVLSVDTTQATSSDRVKIYINGVRETSFSVETYPSQNYDTGANSAVTHMIGSRPSGGAYFDGSMSHFHFIDGTAYDASTFGETDATTGIWKPKTAPSVTYGTNGFFLKFENSGSMGTDSSPNGNNFTVNGTLTQTVDTPSNVFATLNPLWNPNASITLSNGNLTQTVSGSYLTSATTLGASQGKWYAEYKATDVENFGLGITPLSGIFLNTTQNVVGDTGNGWGFYYNWGTFNYRYNSTNTGNATTFSNGDIVMIAMDLDNSKVFFGKNGTWLDSGDPVNGTNPAFSNVSSDDPIGFAVACESANGSFNFGNGYFGTTAVSSATTDESGLGIFEYTVPSGYYALCTKNINTQG